MTVKLEKFCNDKATKLEIDGVTVFVSYTTPIAIRKNGEMWRFLKDDSLYSATTARHVKTMLGLTKSDYFRLPVEEYER